MRYITTKDRYAIEKLWKAGATRKEIAEATGISHATICRELKRGYDGTAIEAGRCGYSAEVAIQNAGECAKRKDEGRRKPRERRVIRRQLPHRT